MLKTKIVIMIYACMIVTSKHCVIVSITEQTGGE